MNKQWDAIHTERRALLDDLEQIDRAQWAAPSSCGDWSVGDVVGHIIATAKITPPSFLAGMITSGFRFHSMNAKRARAEGAGTPDEVLARLRGAIDLRNKPPGPLEAMVGEIVVHAEDIRRPLGIPHTYLPEALATTADFHRRGNLLIGGKRRVTGLRLQATDQDWRAGEGPEVTGPMTALVSAIAGRSDAIGALDGPGVATLRSRMA